MDVRTLTGFAGGRCAGGSCRGGVAHADLLCDEVYPIDFALPWAAGEHILAQRVHMRDIGGASIEHSENLTRGDRSFLMAAIADHGIDICIGDIAPWVRGIGVLAYLYFLSDGVKAQSTKGHILLVDKIACHLLAIGCVFFCHDDVMSVCVMYVRPYVRTRVQRYKISVNQP